MSDSLERYREKRDTGRSGEPSGDAAARQSSGGADGRFVIQKHDASRLHYDLRLEVDGVLKSWAVPKGPTTDPRDKRLAIQTEDHPLEYLDFEGVIPEGEYGAGTVLVWDTGPYHNLRADKDEDAADMAASVADGLVEVRLDGKKLHGGYVLKRTRGDGEKSQWLLIKMKDEGADARRKPTKTEPESVTTGRDLSEVADEEGGD
jgi:DNA ligase D-like protein (predicted 3'-phosphoesterase)